MSRNSNAAVLFESLQSTGRHGVTTGVDMTTRNMLFSRNLSIALPSWPSDALELHLLILFRTHMQFVELSETGI